MVQIDFELSAAVATMLQNHSNNEQKRIDMVVELALSRYFDKREITSYRDPDHGFVAALAPCVARGARRETREEIAL
ncbi:MAG: hypothetical protein M3Z14_07360 [Candidatus Eremiobacteraeota bacterium]|nr:hypothetical protein [Candidatus Eremiobacteraeota bacterium]